EPGEVVGAVLGVARTREAVDAAVDRLRRIEDREAILADLTVREHRVLHGRRDHAGARHEGDLVDLVEALEAGALARAVVLADEERVTVDLARRLGRFLLLTLLAGRGSPVGGPLTLRGSHLH